MADSSREPSAFGLLLPRALLAGVAFGALCVAATGLILFEAVGLLGAATGLTATFAVSLLMGAWAGAPHHESDEASLTERWVAAGIAAAIAGAYASFLAIMGTTAGGAMGRVVGLLALAAVPAYTYGMLLPVLLARGERYEEESEDEPHGWGPLGALLAGSLGGFTLGVLAAGVLLLTWLGPAPLLLIVSVMLLSPVVLPLREARTSDERLLTEIHSAFGDIRVTEVVFPGERQPERRLYLGDEQESGELVRSGAPTLAYIAAAERWLTTGTREGASYLFLGGGAFTLPRRIAEHDPGAAITVVELDPEITRVAYRFFGLRREHGVNTIHGDARAFLESAGDQRWDRIYLDVYAGTESLPYTLVTREAFAALQRRLAPGGVLGINLIGITRGAEGRPTRSVLRTLREVLPHVEIFLHLGPDFPERQNLLVLASAEPLPPLPDAMGIFMAWPASEWRLDEGVVYQDLLPEGEGGAGGSE